jgi:hypothetical protein
MLIWYISVNLKWNTPKNRQFVIHILDIVLKIHVASKFSAQLYAKRDYLQFANVHETGLLQL